MKKIFFFIAILVSQISVAQTIKSPVNWSYSVKKTSVTEASATFCKAQDSTKVVPSIEKSIYGIQLGFLNVLAYNEARLSNNIALRTEVGFHGQIWGGTFYEKTGFAILPTLTVEPRLYYNLNRRVSKSRSIKSNSGNFISLKTSFYPDWFVFSNYKTNKIVSTFFIIPSWGIRRQIGKHFNYEMGAGIGYGQNFAKSAGYAQNKNGLAVDIRLRLGYTF